jgi:iron transport multicopper oxidase
VANTELKFVPGKKYKIRVVNMAALAGVVLFFDQHKMQVIEIDAAYVEKTEAEQIYLSPAQRYSFIIEAKDTADKNYAFSAVFDLNPNFQRPVPTIGFNLNVTGSLQYDSSAPFPAPITTQSWKILDDFNLKVCQEQVGMCHLKNILTNQPSL